MIPWESQLEIVRAVVERRPVAIGLHGVLSSRHFSNPALGAVYDAAVNCHLRTSEGGISRGQLESDLTQLPDTMRKPALQTLDDVLLAGLPNDEWASEAGRKMAASAEALVLAAKIPGLIDAGDFTALNEASRFVAALAATPGQTVTGAGDDLWQRHAPSGECIPTSIRRLNQYLEGGGLERGRTGVVEALKGMGKSHALVDFGATALDHGFNVFDARGEMSGKETRARYDRSISGLEKEEFLNWLRTHETDLRRRLERLTVMDCSRGPMSLHAIEREVDRAPRDRKPDLILIDYQNLLTTGARMEGDMSKVRMAELALIAKDMKAMAERRGCAVWTAHQANRGAYGKMNRWRRADEDAEEVPLDVGDAAEAVAAMWPHDVVISLNQNITESGGNVGRVYLAENRQGVKRKIIEVSMDWRVSRVRDCLA